MGSSAQREIPGGGGGVSASMGFKAMGWDEITSGASVDRTGGQGTLYLCPSWS